MPTIASTVERGTAVPAERALVAAVIEHRLRQGMQLGMDATIRHGLGIPGRPRFKGLPPTAIGDPGLASLRAGAPGAVDYLSNVRKPGSLRHVFTADEEEFCRTARECGYGC